MENMNVELLAQYGLAAYVIATTITHVLKPIVEAFISQKTIKGGNGTLSEVHDMVEDLHKWHDTEDESGRKRWYAPVGQMDMMNKLTANISELTAAVNLFIKTQQMMYDIERERNK